MHEKTWRGPQAGAGFLSKIYNHGKPVLEQAVPEGQHTGEGPYTGAVPEELQPVGRAGQQKEGLLKETGAVKGFICLRMKKQQQKQHVMN